MQCKKANTENKTVPNNPPTTTNSSIEQHHKTPQEQKQINTEWNYDLLSKWSQDPSLHHKERTIYRQQGYPTHDVSSPHTPTPWPIGSVNECKPQ